MTVTVEENAVVLHAESEWERKALKQLKQKGAKRIKFEDEWNQQGGLRLESPTEAEYWGR